MKTQTKLTLTLAAAAALMMTGCGGRGSSDSGNSGYTPVPFDAPPISEAQKAEFLNAINAARSQSHTCGEYGTFPPAPPVQWSDALYRAAAEHSYDMATANITGHDGSGTASDWTAQVQDLDGGSDFSSRAINNGYNGGLAENVYWCRGSSFCGNINSAIRGWLGSPDHCASLMGEEVKIVGVANAKSTSSDWEEYWTLEMGE